jgi:hypothetical protein
MKLALCILAVICVFAVATRGQKVIPRRITEPARYYNGEQFLELNENDRMVYTIGLMDGFYGSGLFGATNETVASLSLCTKDMDAKQISAIITKYVKDRPENWHVPLSIEAFNALNVACPGGLKVIDPKN